MPKANKGRIGGDVLADIKKWTKNKPELKEAIKRHQEKHYARIAKRELKTEPQAKMSTESFNRMMAFNKYNAEQIRKASIAPSLFTQLVRVGNVPVAPTIPIPKDHLKKCTNILIDGMVKEGAKKMRKLIRATNYKTGQIINLPTINEREAELGNAPKGTIHNPCSSIAEACETIGNKDGAVVFVKSGVLTPKKKRIPTRFNAKKLKEKYSELWTAIATSVCSDMEMQKYITTNIYRYKVNVSNNAAFTAIVEMIKRGLL